MVTPTIAQIAAHNQRAGNHYFDRDTLKFFGQRRGDFRVRKIDGRVIVYCRVHRGWNTAPEHGIATLAEYNPETGEVSTPEDADDLRRVISKAR